jgi:hypothetical protein
MCRGTIVSVEEAALHGLLTEATPAGATSVNIDETYERCDQQDAQVYVTTADECVPMRRTQRRIVSYNYR